MAEADRSIPSGLNRIRTRRIPPDDHSSSAGDCSPMVPVPVRPAGGGAGPRTPAADGKGSRRGRKIARWISSYLASKDSNKASKSTVPNSEAGGSSLKKKNNEEAVASKRTVEEKDVSWKQNVPDGGSVRNSPVPIKSFSHELVPRGAVRPAQLRARSYSDLKDILGSLQSKFDAAKEVVNAELFAFAGDVVDALTKEPSLSADGTAEDILVLSQQCAEMTPSEFRDRCEKIVQTLAERRQQCQTGRAKQLLTRMLFILTRCTRLLQFQKDNGPINEDSLDRFKQCLESVPNVEMKWVPKPGKIYLDLNSTTKYRHIPKHPVKKHNADYIHSKQSFTIESDTSSSSLQHHLDDVNPPEVLPNSLWYMHHGREELSDGPDSVMCRICEKNVPTCHLESHSYICAYADKCDLEPLNVDERLIRIAEMLEQIMESYDPNFHVSYSSPEISRIQSAVSEIEPECHSPKLQEWHSKGTEGMFEDLHEMDTASLDDSHVTSSNHLRSLLAMKLGPCHTASSNGSMTPGSSTTTPRSSHFDLYWLELNNPTEHEDLNQMNEMADIARKVASTDPVTEGAAEHLEFWLHDLLDILRHSRLKALVIDTFGSRILNLLKEKFLLATELMDKKRPQDAIQPEEDAIGNSSQCTILAPVRPSNKERTSIDDFEIIKPISRGAFGKVFLARKRTTGDLFAIKVLKKLNMIRKNDIERILAERNILITVRNQFVVRFFYSFTCRDNLYLVMEYLNGGDLYSLLRKVCCLEEDIARIYIAELVLALEYVHSLGIVHRDLKPDNILIARDGHIKLTDFGLSKIGLINSSMDLSGSEAIGSVLLDAQNQHPSPEHAHISGKQSRCSAVGTPDYLAPEILLGTAHGYAADWWSVGIILFEFLTGIPPFTARLPEAIFDNILNRKIPWPCVPDDMSYEAKDLIDRFLIQDPDLRLGANGASEVKGHPFFKEINWDSLALQKAAFIPNPDSADDTSYFMSRYSLSSCQTPVDENFSECTSDTTESNSSPDLETNMDECKELMEFDNDTSIDLSAINFSFKNLSQLASMNYDVLLQYGKTSKSSSPSKGP